MRFLFLSSAPASRYLTDLSNSDLRFSAYIAVVLINMDMEDNALLSMYREGPVSVGGSMGP